MNLIQNIKKFFIVIIVLSSLTCFQRPDFNLPLFAFAFFLWDSPKNDEDNLFRSFSKQQANRTPSTYQLSWANSEKHSEIKQTQQLQEIQVEQFKQQNDLPQVLGLAKLMSNNRQKQSKTKCDRYIPLRKAFSCQDYRQQITQKIQSRKGKDINDNKVSLGDMYKMLMLQKSQNKLFNFAQSNKKKDQQNLFIQKNQKLFNNKKIIRKQSQQRKIAKAPFKVLDAPNLQDDFYLNLLQWSSKNQLAVALSQSLYIWNGNNNSVVKFANLDPLNITSLAWNGCGNSLAIGDSDGCIGIYDVQKKKKFLSISGHSARVSSLSWSNPSNGVMSSGSNGLLASGSRDRTIRVSDFRTNPKQVVNVYQGHTQQVCGLKWSPDGQSLASGGNDNKLFIWSPQSCHAVHKLSHHTAAVKALAWSPHTRGLLASGGGSADRMIRFWNVGSQKVEGDSIDSGSQVCNLMFSKNSRQLVSTHGYANNQIIVWKYPSLQKMTTLTGHNSRVLFLAMSPNGQNIVTGAGDETLRFWNVFPPAKKHINAPNNLSKMVLR